MSAFYSEDKYVESKARTAVIIIASFIIMLCAGSVYAWSVFVNPLIREYNFTTTDTQMVFGFILALFAVAMLFGNFPERKWGPRITSIMGSFFFTAGYLTASLSGGRLWLITTGLGVLSGIGMALGYIPVLTSLNMWLPKYKGLATGIAASGFGGGAILMSYIAESLLQKGMAVLDVFKWLGIILGSLFFIASLFLTRPRWESDAIKRQKLQFSYLEILKDRRYWVLFYTVFAAAFSGLFVTGNLKPLGISFGVSKTSAALGIGIMSIGNAIGRLTWGQLFDMIGARASILISIISVVTLPVIMLFTMHSDTSFIVLVLLFGFCFGADVTLYAANVASVWGVRKLGIIYPMVFLAYGISAIAGPVVGGMFYDLTGSYNSAMIVSSIVCFTAFVVYGLLMPAPVKKGIKKSDY